MTKYERIRTALVGGEVDRLPFSFWYHFTDIPIEERWGEALAKAQLQFYQTYDPDFLKIMHDVPYDLPEGKEHIDNLEDWKQVPVVDPAKGNFGRQLEAIRLVLEEVGEEVPVVDTVFNCFAYAERITGKRTMELLREEPGAFHEGMKRIARTLCDWAEAIIQQGASGIYLAVQGASEDYMTEEEYRREFLPYDHQILDYIENTGRLNIVHLHGDNLHWGVWNSLPFHALSWSSNITPPTIAAAREQYSGCIVGGVNERDIGTYNRAQVKEEILQAKEESGNRGLIVASGCAVPTDCPPANLHAFKEAVEELAASENSEPEE